MSEIDDKISAFRARNIAKRRLPQRLKEYLDGLKTEVFVIDRNKLAEILEDAADEVESHRAKTAIEIGFTYEPTKERVRLFSLRLRCLEIVSQNPEILSTFVTLNMAVAEGHDMGAGE